MTGRRADRVLITVSGVIADDVRAAIDQGRRPRADYLELAEAFGGADLLDRSEVRSRGGRVGRWVERLAGPNAAMAVVCFRLRKQYDVVFTDGEQVGLPFALLRRIARAGALRHLMVVHILSVPKKVLLFRLFALQRGVDVLFTYATSQRRFLIDELGVPEDKVVQTTFMVDTEFFSPDRVEPRPADMICAVGLELRDYPTMLEAVAGLDVKVVIAAASPWSKRRDTTKGVDLPPNVEVCSLDPVALRQLYADSRFMVMPLYETRFQAGVTSLLEAMSMGKAIICSRTEGQSDVVQEGETGLYVPPGDPVALRHAIEALLGDPASAERMGEAGRRHVVECCEVQLYANRLAAAGLARSSKAPASVGGG